MSEPLSDDDRRGLLWKLYDAVLLHLVKELAPDASPSAVVLNIARRFLLDNGINASSRPDIRRGLNTLADFSKLPFKVGD